MFEQYPQTVVQQVNEKSELIKLSALNYQNFYHQFSRYNKTVKILRSDSCVQDKKYVLSPFSQALDFMTESELENLLAEAEEYARLVNNNLFRLKDYFEELGELVEKIENCTAIIEDNLFELEEIVH